MTKSKNKRKMYIIFILLWITIIFLFSNMKGVKSDSASKGIIYKTVEICSNIIGKNLSSNELQRITNNINYPFRKCMHASVYFILSILTINAFIDVKMENWKKYMYTIICCFIYAILDESHQLYIDGRTGQMLDVWIDTIGSIMGCITFKLFKRNV